MSRESIAERTPAHYIGFCDECRQAKTFSSERERELWQKFHPHEEDGA